MYTLIRSIFVVVGVVCVEVMLINNGRRVYLARSVVCIAHIHDYRVCIYYVSNQASSHIPLVN